MDHDNPAGTEPVSLEPTALMEAASREARLDEWGDASFREPLERWLLAAVAEANLNAAGVFGLQANVVRLLVNRLRTQDFLCKHPEILEEDVSDPIVVLGFPRTGTTKLQRLLSCDPGNQRLAHWRALNVAPFPGWERAGDDARIAVAEMQVQAVADAYPDFMAVFPIGADEANEDAFLLDMTFESMVQTVGVRVPSYSAWLRDRPQDAVYAYERTLLQFLQWQDGGRNGRPWILKSPCHLGSLGALAGAFPKVTVVHNHRDLAVALPSLARLVELARRTMTDEIDLVALGDELLSMWSHDAAKYVEVRDRLGDRLPVIDVQYDEIVGDPISVIRKIYGIQGRPLSSDAEERMRLWEKENPQYRYGRKPYSLERYGLTPERINEAFRPYLDCFGGS